MLKLLALLAGTMAWWWVLSVTPLPGMLYGLVGMSVYAVAQSAQEEKLRARLRRLLPTGGFVLVYALSLGIGVAVTQPYSRTEDVEVRGYMSESGSAWLGIVYDGSHFLGGTVDASVVEEEDRVTVRVRISGVVARGYLGHSPQEYHRTTSVTLQTPLGKRAVVSAVSGQELWRRRW